MGNTGCQLGRKKMENGKVKHIYLCEDSIEGIFTAIYTAWASGYGHANNYIQINDEREMQLFSEYIIVVPDPTLSMKVTNSIRNKIGHDAYRFVYHMVVSNVKEKADIIYRFMILGFHYGPKVMDYLSNEYVSAICKTYRKVNFEAHHYKGFVRFSELSSHIMCSRIRPDHNILTLIAPHFADRLPLENWMIIDEGRQIAAVHPANKAWFLVSTNSMDNSLLTAESEKEKRMKDVWNTFVDSISIKERENLKLQRNMCPLRYREFMPEFQKENTEGED